MLCLTRSVHNDNTLIIQTKDGDITISIEKITGGQVRIGIDAPAHVKVLRSELLDKEAAA